MECGVSLCGIYKSQERGGHSPCWAVAPQEKNVCIDLSPMTAPLQKPKHVSKVNANKECLLIKL